MSLNSGTVCPESFLMKSQSLKILTILTGQGSEQPPQFDPALSGEAGLEPQGLFQTAVFL